MTLREVLCECVQEYGLTVLIESDRTIGLVADRLSGQRRDRWLIRVCYEARVVDGLLADTGTLSQERLARRLIDDFALEAGAARHVVEAIAAAIQQSAIASSGDCRRATHLRGREVVISQWAALLAAAVGAICIALAAINARPAAGGLTVLLAAVVLAAFVVHQYRILCRRMRKAEYEKSLLDVVRQLASLELQARHLSARCAAQRKEVTNAEAMLAAHVASSEQRLQKWNEQLAAIQAAKTKALSDAERTASCALDQRARDGRDRIATLRRELSSGGMLPETVVAQQIRQTQRSFVVSALQRSELRDARLDGLGEHGISRLAEKGYRTAYDVLSGHPESVFGVGQRERYAIKVWAQGIADAATRNAPSELEDDVRRRLLAEHDQHLAQVRSEIAVHEQELTIVVEQIQERVTAARNLVERDYQAQYVATSQDRERGQQVAHRRALELTLLLQQAQRASRASTAEQKRCSETIHRLFARREELARQNEALKTLTLRAFIRSMMRRNP